MDRRALGSIAIVLVLLMIIVATAGLDNLPRELRSSVSAASSQVQSDREAFQRHKAAIQQAMAGDPALFKSKSDGWTDQLRKQQACLNAEVAALSGVQTLAAANRRTDGDNVRAGLNRVETARSACQDVAGQIDRDAHQWVEYKRALPARLTAMTAAHDAIASFDLHVPAAAVEKAKLDWPAKADALQQRLDQLGNVKTNAEGLWSSSETLRTAAAAGDLNNFDYAAFFQDADALEQSSRNLKSGASTITGLSDQLYTSWDKLLLNVDVHDGQEKVRIVRTKFPDATLTNGQTSSEERWETIDQDRARDQAKNLEMVIARKPAGKFDSESENVVQPPAIAYVAPPGQANSYGSWENGIWHWLPQYLLLSQLLNAARYHIDTNDYNAWRYARERGEIYYGRNRSYAPPPDVGYRNRSGRGGFLRDALGALILSKTMRSGSGNSSSPEPPSQGGWWKERPKASSPSPGTGTGGGFYRERPKPSWGSSGYSGSRYQSRGTFSGSKYQSRGTYGSGFGTRSYSRGGFSGGMRSMGRGGRR